MNRPSVIASLARSPFVRNFAIVARGTVIAQAASFAAIPLISRFYAPSEFGVYGVFTSVVAVIGAVVALQYSQALVLPKRHAPAQMLLLASFVSVAFFSVISVLIALIFPSALLGLLGAPETPILLALFPIAVAARGVARTLQAWCVRLKRFRLSSGGQIARSGLTGLGQIVFGLAGATHVGLVAGMIVGEASEAVTMMPALRRNGRLKRRSWRTIVPRIRAIAWRYRDFPLYAAPQNLLNAVSQGIPVLLLATFYGAGAAGYYALAVRVLRAPMLFILSPLRQVLLQKVAEVHNSGGDLRRLFVIATSALLGGALVPCTLLLFFAPTLFSWFLGAEWRDAGEYGQWLVVALIPAFCNAPSGLVARVLRRQRELLVFDIVMLAGRTMAILLGARYLSALGTVALFSVVSGVVNLALITWVFLLLRKRSGDVHPLEGDPGKEIRGHDETSL